LPRTVFMLTRDEANKKRAGRHDPADVESSARQLARDGERLSSTSERGTT
jgi:hypothetical protein